MPDHQNPESGLRRRDAFGLAAAALGAVLGMRSSAAMATESKRASQPTTPTHRPFPGMDQTRFQSHQTKNPGPLGHSR